VHVEYRPPKVAPITRCFAFDPSGAYAAHRVLSVHPEACGGAGRFTRQSNGAQARRVPVQRPLSAHSVLIQ